MPVRRDRTPAGPRRPVTRVNALLSGSRWRRHDHDPVRTGGQPDHPPRGPADPQASRRGFLGGAALIGAALAVNPWGYLVRPASAYDTVCGTDAGLQRRLFRVLLHDQRRQPTPARRTRSSAAGGRPTTRRSVAASARYYIDCNAYRGDDAWQCRCASGTCDQRRVACNQFRYGQCSLQIPQSTTGPVVCRMVSCTPPWQQFAGVCTSSQRHRQPHRHPLGALQRPGPDRRPGRRRAGHRRRCGSPGGRWTSTSPPPRSRSRSTSTASVSAGSPPGCRGTMSTAALRDPGQHGFDITVPAGCRTAPRRHLRDQRRRRGHQHVAGHPHRRGRPPPARSPSALWTRVTAGPDGTLRVPGWAFDPDAAGDRDPGRRLPERRGRRPGSPPAGRGRMSARAWASPAITASTSPSTVPPGDHDVAVFASTSAAAPGTPLAIRSVRGAGSAPVGHLDCGGRHRRGRPADRAGPTTPTARTPRSRSRSTATTSASRGSRRAGTART